MPFDGGNSNTLIPDHYEVYISKNEGIDWELVKTIDTHTLIKVLLFRV